MRLPAAEDLISDHGRSLYDYCSLWLGDKLATVNAVRNTFALAVVHQDLYPGHEHLRSWLYAIARVHCLAQPHYGGFTTAPFPPISGTPHGDDTELTANAMGALGRREREVLELIHRHGLSIPAVGLVLGVPTDEAARLALSAQDLVESFVTCVRLAQTGRSVCRAGEPIALDWLESPRRELRSRLKTHLLTCGTCAQAANLTVSVPALLARLPIAELDDLARARIEQPARPESVEIRWSQHDYPLQPDAYDTHDAYREPAKPLARRHRQESGHAPRRRPEPEPEPMFRDSRGRPRSMPLGAPVYADYYADTDTETESSGPSGPYPTEDAREERRPPAPRLPEEVREGRAPLPWEDKVWENRPALRLPDSAWDDATPLRTRRPRANPHLIPGPRRPLDDDLGDLAPAEEIWDRRITARVPAPVRERSVVTGAEVWDENVSTRGKLSRRGTRARARRRRESRERRRENGERPRRPVRVVALGAAALLIVSLAWRGLSARDYHPSGLTVATTGAREPVAVPQLTKPVPTPARAEPSAVPAVPVTSAKPKPSPAQRRTQPASSKPVVRPVVKPVVKKPAPVVRPALTVRPQRIELQDGVGTVAFSVNAGTVKWRAVSEDGLVELNPGSGAIAAGQKIRLEIGLTDAGLGTSSCLFESDDVLDVETSAMDVITIRWTGRNKGVSTDGKITLTVVSCASN
ncbi:RNA polymerase sigma factor [Acrocarpospora corrugata]|nr:hypothetical protein [Acrocarpospora corrugata]